LMYAYLCKAIFTFLDLIRYLPNTMAIVSAASPPLGNNIA